MPLYSYECNQCLKEVDLLRSMSESSLPVNCPSCGSPLLKKLASGSFHFKGGSPTRSRQGV